MLLGKLGNDLRTGKAWLFWLALRELWAWRYRSFLSLLALALSVGLVAVSYTHLTLPTILLV